MGKRGRKPNPDKKKNYFCDEEEAAVVEYLNCNDAERKNEIYNEILRPAFKKMVESIIRRYKLYVPGESMDFTFNDALSFLLMKADKFEPGKYKAYSYYGTVCKHYLIGRIQSYNKSLLRNQAYDDAVPEFINDIKYSDEVERAPKIMSEAVEMLIEKIGEMLNNPKGYSLRDNEIKLGTALKNLLENWDYVLSTDGSNKLNKNAILFFLREQTGLDTKGIRDNMKKFKNEFFTIKGYLIE
jgi:hypothetical protein